MVALIGTDNLVKRLNPTITTVGQQDPLFPYDNVKDGLTWSIARENSTEPNPMVITFDFGSDVTANAGMAAGHNLATLADPVFYVQHSPDASNWTNLATPVNWLDVGGRDNAALSYNPTAQTARYWRFVFDASQTTPKPEIGVCWIGLMTPFYRGIQGGVAIPTQNRTNRLLNNFGGDGQLLGTRVEQRGGRTPIAVVDITWADWEANLRQHYDRIVEAEPFCFTWNSTRYDASAYCVAPEVTNMVTYRDHGRVNFAVTALTL